MEMFELIDDCVETIDNTITDKQRKKRKEVMRKWIEEVVVPAIDTERGGKIWCSYQSSRYK